MPHKRSRIDMEELRPWGIWSDLRQKWAPCAASDLISLEQMTRHELRWREHPAPDPCRTTLGELNADTDDRSKRAAWNNRYRAHGDATAEDLDQMRRDQNDQCGWCGAELYGVGVLDHIIPVCRGGRTDVGNLMWACRPCNQRKRWLTLEEWEAERWNAMP